MRYSDILKRVAVYTSFFTNKPLLGIKKDDRLMSENRNLTDLECKEFLYVCARYLAEKGESSIRCQDGIVTFGYVKNKAGGEGK